jgi:hypothetical protein
VPVPVRERMVRNQSRTRASAKPPRVGGTLAGLWPFRVGDLVSPSGDAVYVFWRDDERLVIVAALNSALVTPALRITGSANTC